jgi:hypothetical protein
MSRTATFVKDLSKRREREEDWLHRANGKRRKAWYKGTFLYKLSEPYDVNAGGFYTATEYVIVAVTPAASDHGRPETQAFAAMKDGGRFGGFTDKSSPDKEDWFWVHRLTYDAAALEHSRIVGRHDPAACLAKLGYELV